MGAHRRRRAARPGDLRRFRPGAPQNVQAVIIRELTYTEAVLVYGRAEAPEGQELLHAGEPGEDTHGYQHVGENRIPWIYGPDGKAISEQLTELGLLR